MINQCTCWFPIPVFPTYLCLICVPPGWVHLWPWQRCWRPGVHHWRRMKSGVCYSPPLTPYWTFPKGVTTYHLPFITYFYLFSQLRLWCKRTKEMEVQIITTDTPTFLWSVLCLGSGNMYSVLSPSSVLLSANGSLAFKSCARYEDVASFTAPEVQQGHTASTGTVAEKVWKTRMFSRCSKVLKWKQRKP